MRKTCLSIIFFSIIAALLFIPHSEVQAEKIKSYDVTLKIRSDGVLSVSEKINYDFGILDRHGIIRNIPEVKTNSEGAKFRLSFDSFSVTDENGISYRYNLSKTGGIVKLKIGDPDRTITGVHLYAINYIVRGAITYFSDHDELYWNITGNDWNIPIDSVTASVELPHGADPSKINLSCFVGKFGSTSSDCSKELKINAAYFTAVGNLSPGEGMTIVVGFPKHLVSVLEPEKAAETSDTPLGRFVSGLTIVLISLATLFWYIGLPGYIVVNWWLNGRDPVSPVGEAHVWFDVPKTKTLRPLTPGETGTLVDENADMRDITATIVDLARRGYLKIVEKKRNDFYFVKQPVLPKGNLEPHEDTLFRNFFSDSDEVRLKDGNFVKPVEKAKEQLYQAVVKEGYFEKNPRKVRTLYLIIAVLAMATFNFPLAFVCFIFGLNMPKKTIFGVQAANLARSLKNFLASQKHQLEYQAKNQLFFEKLLPYAIAFGVEKIWAARFSDIGMKPPDWYVGYDNTAFNSVIFANALSSSMKNFSASATPTRSSSGFSSGFSGGFSGGGGGGGGGGSW